MEQKGKERKREKEKEERKTGRAGQGRAGRGQASLGGINLQMKGIPERTDREKKKKVGDSIIKKLFWKTQN